MIRHTFNGNRICRVNKQGETGDVEIGGAILHLPLSIVRISMKP